MSRKDIILSAVLINTGILVVLFIGGVRSSDSGVSLTENTSLVHAPSVDKPKESDVDSIDLVDTVLNKYIEKDKQKDAELICEIVDKGKEDETKRIFKEVIIKQGDVLDKIAKHYHTSSQDLIEINSLPSTKLQIGQILRVPYSGEMENRAEVQVAKSEERYYTVKSGDNPWTIAVKNGLKVEELMKLNGLDGKKGKVVLRPGDQLRVK